MQLVYKGIPVNYFCFGKGSAVVLLHGFLENCNMWFTIKNHLAKKHKVITIDLLGHGKTPCLGYMHTMEDQAKMVHAILKHLHLRKYYIIGHSMGGYIALNYAKLFQKNVKGICLLNSTYAADSPERINLRKRAIKMAKNNYENLVRMSFVNLFSENSKIKYIEEINAALTEALKTPITGYIAANQGMAIRPDLTHFFKELTCKKAIFLGKKDHLLPVANIVNFSGKNNIYTQVFSEGHMSHIENAEETLQAIINFIKL